MPERTLQPPLTPADQLISSLRQQGFAVLSPASVCALAGVAQADLDALSASWSDLPPDQYLKDGGRYRRRRHASLEIQGPQVRLMPHRAHWQPLSYNALHGGMQRWFEPVLPQVLDNAAWQGLLRWLAQVASEVQGAQPWFAEAHQFRIDTTDGIGRPTPEGAHRDGVNWVAVFLVGRHGIKGGEPWSLLLLDDHRVIHETTPIQPVDGEGWRDTLVITLRAQGFLDDPTQAAQA